MSPRPRRDPHALTMSTPRRIERVVSGAAARSKTQVAPIGDVLAKAGAELSALAEAVLACTACQRCERPRTFGTGFPQAAVMLIKDAPSAEDIRTGTAFADEAEALSRAFAALEIPLSRVYGTTAVRCGDESASMDETKACSPHLLVELEAVAPRIVIAFGQKAADAVRLLDGQCGLSVPETLEQGQPTEVRAGLSLLVTEALPDGIRVPDSKKRLWRDLQLLPEMMKGPE